MQKLQRDRIQRGLMELVEKALATDARIRNMLTRTGVSKEALLAHVYSYTLGIGDRQFSNVEYQDLAMRATLYFHMLAEGSYHLDRQRLVKSFLDQCRPAHSMDIGYGILGEGIAGYLASNEATTALLVDQDASAAEFAKLQLLQDYPNLRERISFSNHDMDKMRSPGDADCYLLLDSVEHTRDPTGYLKLLVDAAPRGSHFIFSIPICPLTGLENFHFAEWLSDQDARDWLGAAGLNILEEGNIFTNPEVDFFAEFVEGGYHNFLVLCRK